MVYPPRFNKLATLELTLHISHRSNYILPYDHNRVRLLAACEHGDYVNASWVAAGKTIAAQSPLPATVPHFLKMVPENKGG